MSSLPSRPSRLNRGARVPLSCALLLAVALLPRAAAARRYTLPELIARVDAVYPGVQAARAGVGSADAQLSQANRLWWPTGQLTFGITGAPDVRCTDAAGFADSNKAVRQANCIATTVVDLRQSSFEQVFNWKGPALNLSFGLLQPLYTFGKIEATQQLARASVDNARAQVDKDRAEVAFNVTRAYWLLKWARTASAVLDDVQSRLKDWIKKINDEIDKGKSTYTENDVVRLKLALDTAAYTALDVDKAKELGLAGVRMLTDDPDADIDEDELDVAEPGEEPLGWYEDAARTHRPEARMLSAGATAARASHKLQFSSLLPDVGVALTFNYGYAPTMDDPANGFMNHPNTIGAGLSLVARYSLDVPMRLANLDKAKADERVMAERRKQALGGISIEIENAWLEARAARRKSDLLGHSEKVARGWYNAVDQNLQVGVAESRDLVDAARSYFELRMRHLQSIMDVNMAEASLKQTAGLLVK